MEWRLWQPATRDLILQSDVSGELLVDIGSGSHLVPGDEFPGGQQEGAEELLQDEGGCSLDWTPFLQHVCKLEGRRPSAWTEKAARLRQVIVDIVPIDVNRPQPLAHDALPSAGADCLVSCFCLESAFTRALGHIGRLLRPGGHLLLIGTLGMSYYMAGAGVKIPTVPVNEAQVCASLKESGYTLIRNEDATTICISCFLISDLYCITALY
uniref:Phenylethanolamine N-methyltransferase n=1 Tax=Sander lucioperca TaxID=283035 RepID=A0A8D0ARG5_SANLU